MRDDHDIISGSTSPPPKKIRIKKENSIESMDVDESQKESHLIEDEDMDIEETEEEKIATLRSNKWDERIKESQNKEKIKDKIQENKKNVLENKNKSKEEQKSEQIKNAKVFIGKLMMTFDCYKANNK